MQHKLISELCMCLHLQLVKVRSRGNLSPCKQKLLLPTFDLFFPMVENDSPQARSSYSSSRSNSNSDDPLGCSSSSDEEQIVKNRLRKRKLVYDHNVGDDRSSPSDHEKSDAAEDLVNNRSSASERSSMEEITVKTRISRPKITNHSSAMNFDTENGRTARKFMIITINVRV